MQAVRITPSFFRLNYRHRLHGLLAPKMEGVVPLKIPDWLANLIVSAYIVASEYIRGQWGWLIRQ